MHHKILSIILACSMLLGMLCPAVLAESTLWTDAESMHGQVLNRSLVRAYGDGYEYFTYEPTTFEVYGKLGGMHLDLDGDGADEYLYVGMDTDNIASLTVFEQKNGSWYAAASTVLYEATLNYNIAANDVFLKYNGDSWLIFNENWIQENCCADGAAWDFHAYMYSGNTLYTLTDIWADGTDITGDLDAWLNDAGLSFARVFGDAWRVNAKLDGFCNLLKDKIISASSELDPYLWLPYNIGRVRSLGVDAVTGFDWQCDDWLAGLNARYSWQSAVDVTDDSETYGKPVPYIAKHTFVIDAKVAWKELELRPVWLMRAGRSDGYGDLPSWSTLDLRLAKRFAFGKGGSLSVWLSAKNLLDCRYELVTGYPMPGRSFLCGVEYKF